MHLKFDNVNDAFHDIVKMFHDRKKMFHDRKESIVQQDSRNGPVLRLLEPLMVTYKSPHKRVLFNRVRDANPFFHLYEAIWMLAGRDTVAPLKYFVSTIDNYSDDGKTLWGAYGNRWRHWFDCNQILSILQELKDHPDSRRCVLTTWDARRDPEKARDGGKDVPCNTHAYFSLRESADYNLAYGPEHPDVESGKIEQGTRIGHRYLDMMVCNRSNDVIWGMLGANVVHFSFLQEYLAGMLGVKVGEYTQATNNAHIYVDKADFEGWLSDTTGVCGYCGIDPVPLVTPGPAGRFFNECLVFTEIGGPDRYYQNEFLQHTALPMYAAFRNHKKRDYQSALRIAERIHSGDWRMAATQWLEKREALWRSRDEKASSSN